MKLDKSLCKGCPFEYLLETKGYGIVHPEGRCTNKVGLMGESPEFEEIRLQKPFAYRAGAILNKSLRVVGENREDFIIFNTCQCRIPGGLKASKRDPRVNQAIDHCKAHRDAIINHYKPHTIVALGDYPMRVLTGKSGVTTKRGYPYENKEYNVKVIPTYHPAYLLHSRKDEGGEKGGLALIPTIVNDITKALNNLPIDDPQPLPKELFPTPQDFEEFLPDTLDWFVFDIETPYSGKVGEDALDTEDPSTTIIRAAMAYSPKGPTSWPTRNDICAITFPWQEPYISMVKPYLASEVTKVFHNYDFDMDRLEFNGIEIGGKFDDTMWLFHFLYSDLPKFLGHVAPFYTNVREWKSKSESDPELYSWTDGYVQGSCYMGIEKDLEKRNLLDAASWQVTDIIQILRKMWKRGVQVDPVALTKFQDALHDQKERALNELNEMVPEHLKNVLPKQGYVRDPKDTTGMVQREFTATFKPKKLKHKKCKGTGCNDCDSGYIHIPGRTEKVTRWCRIIPFKPSRDQVARMMMHLEIELPIDPKTKKPTTAAKFLKRKINIHPFFQKVLDYREAEAMVKYGNWTIEKDGRVHPKFRLTPASGRLSSHNPNFQNMPQFTDLAKMFRRCITSSPGYLLLRRDYSSIEGLILGYFSGDEQYFNLAKLGLHAWTLGKYLEIDLPHYTDPQLKVILSDLKKKGDPVLYRKMKACNFAIGFGAGPKRIYQENPGVFEKYGEALQLRKFILNLFPRVEGWQKKVVAQAKMAHYVQLPHKNNRWLWDIPGQDAPKVIAQYPQGTAAAIIKRAMIEIDKSFIGPYMIGQVHDEIILDVPEGRVEEVDKEFKKIMEAPIPELGGLVINTDRKVGRTLDDE